MRYGNCFDRCRVSLSERTRSPTGRIDLGCQRCQDSRLRGVTSHSTGPLHERGLDDRLNGCQSARQTAASAPSEIVFSSTNLTWTSSADTAIDRRQILFQPKGCGVQELCEIPHFRMQKQSDAIRRALHSQGSATTTL